MDKHPCFCIPSNKNAIGDFVLLSRQMLHHSNQGASRLDFLRAISEMMIDFSGSCSLELWAKDDSFYYRWDYGGNDSCGFNFRITETSDLDDVDSSDRTQKLFRIFCSRDLSQNLTTKTRLINANTAITAYGDHPDDLIKSIFIHEKTESLLWIPFIIDDNNSGVLILKSKNKAFFSESDKSYFEGIAQTIGIAIANRRAQVALRERFKELRCMYGICQITNKPHSSLETILHSIVRLLPPAMQYPEICYGRITLDGKVYSTPGFPENREKLTGTIVISGVVRGHVDVTYGRKTDALEVETFLREEKALLDNIARQLALIVERKQAEEEKAQLEEQLRHSDRLATIGQLAAGVAHELNEPIGNILGFAQLASKTPHMPGQAAKDLDRIIESSLHARDIVKKLLTFGRQAPSKKIVFNLNSLVERALSFFETRFANANIKAEFNPMMDVNELYADPGQINQVFINLVVNAMQAMPEGGSIVVSTSCDNEWVYLSVRDTGTGMDENVLRQIFVPFFTTKKVGQGTGLGLSLVHGIVSSHKGITEVKSSPGEGTEFIIKLPV